MKSADIYSHSSGILSTVKPPEIDQHIIEYLFYAPLEMNCTFPPGPEDDIGWIVVGSDESAQAVNAALERAVAETQIVIVSDTM